MKPAAAKVLTPNEHFARKAAEKAAAA
jgi:hypothetical protein